MNRRDFLKLAGISTAASTFNLAFPVAGIDSLYINRVRLLHAVKAHSLLSSEKLLLPDSVHRVLAVYDGWVRLSAGNVPETAVQPMLIPHGHSFDTLPAWVEVIAPYAALRSYATAAAPLIARPDHGSVLYARGEIDDQHEKTWLQAQHGNLTGWVQRSQLQPILLPETMPDVEVVLEKNRLILLRNGHEWMQFPAACPAELPSGEHHILEKSAAWQTPPYPVWNLITDRGLHLGGVTHHNDFSQAGTFIELPFLAAKVTFGILKPGARLVII